MSLILQSNKDEATTQLEALRRTLRFFDEIENKYHVLEDKYPPFCDAQDLLHEILEKTNDNRVKAHQSIIEWEEKVSDLDEADDDIRDSMRWRERA